MHLSIRKIINQIGSRLPEVRLLCGPLYLRQAKGANRPPFTCLFHFIGSEAMCGIEKEGVIPGVHPRTPAAAGAKGPERSGMGEGTGTGEAGAPGRAALQLCNLVAQSPQDAAGRGLSTEMEKKLTGKRRGTVGTDLLQGLREADPGDSSRQSRRQP